MNVSYIYKLINEDGSEGMHHFNYPPSADQLEDYLKKKGLKFDREDNPHVQKDHDDFIENITNRHGAEVAARYGKVKDE